MPRYFIRNSIVRAALTQIPLVLALDGHSSFLPFDLA